MVNKEAGDHIFKISDKNIINNIKLWSFILFLVLFAWLILPVTLAIVLAYFLSPLLQLFHKRVKLPSFLSALLTEILIVVGLAVGLLFLASVLIDTLPVLKENLSEASSFIHIPSAIVTQIREQLFNLFDIMLSKIFQSIQDIMQNLVEVTIFIVAFYFALYETSRNKYWFFTYIPARFRKSFQSIFEEATTIFSYFISVEVRLLMITLALLSIGFFILGFSQPVGKALLISICDFLPFLGIGIFLIPISIIFITIGKVALGIQLLILYVVIQLTRQFAESMMWASTMQIRSVHAFILSAISLLLFGVAGIIISPFILLIAVKLKRHPIFASK
ncbi:AI-2E family transporter [Rummeliibacillus pycnus]|uniref:AI-2E family transporter n=1 Tax=Rummeliibacillus pycnus TaxID=101070 RepID=UPI001475AA8F|nr:AI-2E family transporter [Rummeliibacillus pycnus]